MPKADFFRTLGLLVAPNFLDAGLCEQLVREMQESARVAATVADRPEHYVDASSRRTSLAQVSSQTKALIGERLLALMPAVGRHFGVVLTGCQPPQFLVYREGDFFRPHADQSTSPGVAEFVQQRQVSLVIFLNAETTHAAPGGYCGGALTFYGLLADPRLRDHGFPLLGEAGLLVAFRSATLHEVRPVTSGERCTVVSWFY